MELDSTKLYKVALEQCMLLQQEVIELRALYTQTKEELDRLKSEDVITNIKEELN